MESGRHTFDFYQVSSDTVESISLRMSSPSFLTLGWIFYGPLLFNHFSLLYDALKKLPLEQNFECLSLGLLHLAHYITISQQDVAWSKWLFVMKWLHHTTTDNSLCLPIGTFCREEWHVSLCFWSSWRDPGTNHWQNPKKSRREESGLFPPSFFCYRPQHSNFL